MKTEPIHPKLNDQIRKVLLGCMLAGIVSFLGLVTSGSPIAHVQEVWALDSAPYYTVTPMMLPDGNMIEEVIIHGPPVPPPGFEVERQAVWLLEGATAEGTNTLVDVPAFSWVLGCSAVSGAMIAGYYDRSGWSNIYTGPANGGVMPMNNSSWPTWSDGLYTYRDCPLVASRNGLDGRATRGTIDDYWVQYNSVEPDPYIGHWTQHTWGDAIGDYMFTSQSAYGNADGSTAFYRWTSSANRLTCGTMESYGLPDGTLGRKYFYEDKGYTVTDCYNQWTDNQISGGFSFAQFKAEIDAGRPVMLNLQGHTVVGVGYDDSSSLVYIHDTWDYDTHTMTWGGSYSDMVLETVSIVNLQSIIWSSIYVAQGGLCGGGKSPCFGAIQDAIDSAQSFTVIEITQETYDEDVILDDPKVVSLVGGWDTDFQSSSSFTTINGSITIANGTMIIEYITLK